MSTTFDVRNRLSGLKVTLKSPNKKADRKIHRFENKLYDLKRLIASVTGLAIGTEEYEQFDFTQIEKEVTLKGGALNRFLEALEMLDKLKADSHIGIYQE